MFGLFGGKKDDKKKKKEETQEEVMKAVEKLNLQLSDMEEKISHLEAKKNGIVEMAKEKLKKGDKNGIKYTNNFQVVSYLITPFKIFWNTLRISFNKGIQHLRCNYTVT